MPSRRTLLSTVGAGVAALAGCTETEDPPGDTPARSTVTPRDPNPLDVAGAWPLRRGDPKHTGASEATGIPDAARTHWRLRRLESRPVVVAGGRLFHLAELGERHDRRTVTVTRAEGETYVVRDGTPHLVARDAATADIAWTHRLKGPAAGWPAVAGETVVAGVNGHLLAVDTATGDARWERDLTDTVVRDPTIADGTVYVPTNEDVRAYALADGERLWTAETSEWADGVAIDGDAAYATTTAGDAYAFDAATGDQRWRVDTVGEAAHPPTVGEETLYVGGSAGGLAAHAVADGGVQWERDVGRNGWGGVALAGDRVLYAGGGAVRAFDRTDGSESWHYEPSGEGYVVTPSVASDVVYAGTRGPYDPSLFALGLGSGEERWSLSLPRATVEGDIVDGGLTTPPAVVNGAAYAYAVDGLYALGAG